MGQQQQEKEIASWYVHAQTSGGFKDQIHVYRQSQWRYIEM